MIKKLINVFGIFFEGFTKKLNLLQSTEKHVNKKVSLILLKKKLTFFILNESYFLAGAKYFLLNSIEIAERSNLILPAPVSIVIVLSVAFISTILP